MGANQSNIPIDPNLHRRIMEITNQEQIKRKNEMDIQRLQKQILENQLKIQTHQMREIRQNLSPCAEPPKSTLSYILSSPQLQEDLRKNPKLGASLVESLVKEYGNQLTNEHYRKIDKFLNDLSNQPLTSRDPSGKNLDSNAFLNHNMGTRSYEPREINRQKEEISNDLETLENSFGRKELEAERQYQLEEKKRQQAFIEEQRKRRIKFESEMAKFNQGSFDSLKILELNKNYTMDELRKAYKRLAYQSHPDKGGSNEKFEMITKAYMYLLDELKKKENDQQFYQQRDQSRIYMEKQRQEQRRNVNFDNINNDNTTNNNYKHNNINNNEKSGDRFNSKLFNKLFEENRLEDPNDKGYGDWLRKDDTIPKHPELFSKKFNLDLFNNTFEKWKNETEETTCQEIIKHDNPSELVLTSASHIDLDNKEIDDFSQVQPHNKSVGYTDLKKAYTRTNLINANKVKYQQFKNVDELEKSRAKINFQLSPEDLAKEAFMRQKKEEDEYQRVQRLKNRDQQVFNNYNRVHQMMLDQLK
jgi:curved DNA-binding protein CbpA